MIETAQAFGVDIGGSGIKAAPVDLNKGEFAEPRLKILTPAESTPQAVGEIGARSSSNISRFRNPLRSASLSPLRSSPARSLTGWPTSTSRG